MQSKIDLYESEIKSLKSTIQDLTDLKDVSYNDALKLELELIKTVHKKQIQELNLKMKLQRDQLNSQIIDKTQTMKHMYDTMNALTFRLKQYKAKIYDQNAMN